jgi:hypothetical protein
VSAALKEDTSKVQRIEQAMGDKWWRMSNLYHITDERGVKTLFRPNQNQVKFFENLWYKNIILKARQLGFTTAIQIFILDAVLFNRGIRAGVIAHSLDDAQVFFRDKIKFAYDNIPEEYKPLVPKAIKNDAGELMLDNNSSVRVGTSMRSGTIHYLHVSEYGKICRKYPDKAKEIRTGALPAVHEGSFAFIESTAEGREGDFYRKATESERLDKSGKKLSKLDYKFHFFPWWKDPRYRTDPRGVVIPIDLVQYFTRLQKEHGIRLDSRQMAWYTKRSQELYEDMKREYPSTPEEAFEESVEGAYFSQQMSYLRANRRIGEVPWEPSLPVYTMWDIGVNDESVIWFLQRHAGQNRLFDYHEASGEGFEYYAGILKEKDYNYSKHYFPHDIAVRTLGEAAKKREDIVRGLGIKPIHKVTRARNLDEVLIGINLVRSFLMSAYIDEQMCSQGIAHLDAYRKEWDEKMGTWKRGPLHNAASNAADALRTGVVGFKDVDNSLLEDNLPEETEDY